MATVEARTPGGSISKFGRATAGVHISIAVEVGLLFGPNAVSAVGVQTECDYLVAETAVMSAVQVNPREWRQQRGPFSSGS